MLKTVLNLFSSGFSMAGFSRFMVFSLVVLTLSMGVALALTISDRNALESNLKSANSSIKTLDKAVQDKDQQIEEKARELDTANESFTGCQAALMSQNLTIATGAAHAKEQEVRAGQRAEAQLGKLDSNLSADRQVAATPALTTAWLRGLFQ